MSQHRKFYSSARWRSLRLAHLARHPLCVACARRGVVTPAFAVDHVEPHRGDEQLFFDASNLQSLCESCHNAWKQALECGHPRSGCDANGFPVDPGHHWHRDDDARGSRGAVKSLAADRQRPPSPISSCAREIERGVSAMVGVSANRVADRTEDR